MQASFSACSGGWEGHGCGSGRRIAGAFLEARSQWLPRLVRSPPELWGALRTLLLLTRHQAIGVQHVI